MYTSINTSKDGYNSARMAVKIADKQYMSVGFEWEGNIIPDFALDVMEFMKNNNMETSGVWEGKEEEFAKMRKEVCKECGLSVQECKCKPKNK